MTQAKEKQQKPVTEQPKKVAIELASDDKLDAAYYQNQATAQCYGLAML